MKIPATLPVTGEQSRAARFQLGLSQAAVIEESGLPGHKLKNFETGRFIPDIPFLEKLRDYYAEKGIDLTTEVPTDTGRSSPGINHGTSMIRPVSRMCFYITDQIDDPTVDQILGRMDANDDRIANILNSPVQRGFIGDYDEETEAKQRELFGAMSENYLLFRILQGRNIVGAAPTGTQPGTHQDLLNVFFASSPLSAVGSPAPAVTDEETTEEEEFEQ